VDYDTLSDKILKLCQFNFKELFVALVHLKVMRTYIDGVLRFGIPPKFFLGVIKPSAKVNEAKIL
jgi:V-type H+-transporting ATPase subunit C